MILISPSARNADTTNPKLTNQMTTTNAAKKLTKAGFTVTEIRSGFYQATRAASSYIIEYFRNGGSDSITCINIRHQLDKHDSQSDYCAGVWADNITQAIKLAY
jgi:hypothetical protein